MLLVVTVVVAYLKFKRGMSSSEALEHVKMIRPTMCPNQGFMSQLQEYAKYLQDSRNKDGVTQEPQKLDSSA
ncbi:dual specificity protein phosphatase 1-like isoform X2 [Salvia divinorum]|uniref:Dual specificity protein phosphatase 1-like isoform X2 n=1 Tax=Salvia divinorum TaxID=28513 RepID=A0ABD1GX51_SALDI